MSDSSGQANRQIARAAGVVMLAFLLSQVAGLVRQIMATSAFGTTALMDDFNTANIFPGVLFNLLAGGALASAFIPTFTAFLTREDHPSAWKLASSIINLVVLLLATISLVSTLVAPQIVGLLAREYSPDRQALTAQLLRILLITSTVFGLSGILSGIINSHQRFLLPALASTLYWIGIIIGLVFFVPSMGIMGMAWGAVLGSILHLAVQLPDLFRLPSRKYTPTLGLNNPAVREVVLLMGPRLISVAALQISMIVTSIIANGLPTGSLSSINFAFPIMTMPLVVIGSGIGFATLPTFSAQFARGQLDDMRTSVTASLRGVLLLSIPATLGLILLREPLIAFLFQHGNFTALSTQMVSWALLWYTLGLVAHCALEILVRAFFALHDTKTPALVSAGAMGLNILFCIAFPIWFVRMGWMPLGGLALAITLETAIETTVMFFLLRKRIHGIHTRSLLKGTAAALLATLFMSAALLGWTRFMGSHSAALATLGGVLIGGVVYGLALVLLRVPEIHSLFNIVRKRLVRESR